MGRRTIRAAIAVGAAGFLLGAISFAYAEVLITGEEAKLPPAKGAVSVATRGITRGPKAEFVAAAGDLHSPMHLVVKFESFGGASVDVDSVKVTYLRSPSVDLTARVKPFVKPTGIDMPKAELPPGDHNIRVDLQDTGGRSGTTSFLLKVAP